ncbi:MAG: hypothetical protein Q4F05_09750 [bacterium]|nr:hypothetical protein [bacterium]
MNIIKSDCYQLVRSKMFWIIFVFSCLCGISITLISHGLAAGTLGAEFIGTASGLMDNMVISIIGPILIATYLCNDFSNKTIHSAILYGHGRRVIVWAKVVPCTIMMFLLLLPYVISTLIGFLSGNSFSLEFANAIDSSYMMILAKQGSYARDFNTIAKLVLILFVLALMYLSRISLIFLLSYLIRKPIAVIGIGVILEMGLSILAGVTAKSEVINSIVSSTPFIGMRDNITLSASVPDLLKTAATSIVFLIIIINISTALFNKAEVK